MTDNDAAKALDDIVTAYCMLLGMDPSIPDPLSQTAEQVKLIRTKLAKSAKVDGLLDALKIIEETTNEEIKKRFKCNSLTEKECAGSSRIYSLLVLPRNIARAAIQRFNGEV